MENDSDQIFDDATDIVEDAEEETPLFADESPPKDRRLHTNPFDFAVMSLGDQIKDGSLILQDEFQRRRVWDEIKSSRLIESLIMNVPIPVCYFAEVEDGAYAVVDGQQRLTAIYRYLNNQFPLRGLKVRPELNKKRLFELGSAEQRLIRSRTIRCIVILKESNPEIRFDVFERLNSATVSLNRQELRNSTYRGSLNNLIVKMCELPQFLEIRKARTPDKRMRDAELILRFLAFHFGASQYKGRFTSHLDSYLDRGRTLRPDEIEIQRTSFIRTINKAYAVFGDQAFRRVNERGVVDSQINSAVYDAVMQTFSHIDETTLGGKVDDIRSAFSELCINSEEFRDSISRATRDKSRLNTRLRLWGEALRAHGIDCPIISFG